MIPIEDSLLNKYRSEMTNERNDGWWKEYYRELYMKRLEELKKKQKKEQEKWSDSSD